MESAPMGFITHMGVPTVDSGGDSGVQYLLTRSLFQSYIQIDDSCWSERRVAESTQATVYNRLSRRISIAVTLTATIRLSGELPYTEIEFFMAALRSRCGHYIFIPWFILLMPPYAIGQAIIFCACSLFCLLSFFLFSSNNLSRRRLDVYHTFTNGVALVLI